MVGVVDVQKGTLENCPIEGMIPLSNEQFVYYASLSDEEKRKCCTFTSHAVRQNRGRECAYATNSDYQIRLM